MPALSQIAGCYHTKFVTTSPKAKFKGAEHREFTPENAQALAKDVVREARPRGRVAPSHEPAGLLPSQERRRAQPAAGPRPGARR